MNIDRIAKLRAENASVLSTPLFSEGGVGPSQVFRMSKRQFASLQKNQQRRMEIESEIRQLSKPSEQIALEAERAASKKRLSRITAIKSQVAFIEGLGRMAHRENGKLKPTYQRTVDALNAELKGLES